MKEEILNKWWTAIQFLDNSVLETNASSLCNMHHWLLLLDLQPLPDLKFPDIRPGDLLSQKPAFKLLTISDILFLRKIILKREKNPELLLWVEFLLRYLEINRPTIIKKARHQFGSTKSGRIALLELTALMMDVYFEWEDLRYLNISLKLMDMPGIFSLGSFSREKVIQNNKLHLILIQVRLSVLRQAALARINKS